ncbi:DUF6084 family protein [Streptomyces sp. NPDC018031]|uniref:DUF6084 family protein n=1 Tax=Streptomyces sp. NPDC018031 TaxID=3365033 RepID=UPI0037A78A33
MTAPAPDTTRPTVPELAFRIAGAEPETHAAVPTLRFTLEVTASGAVRAVSLTTTVRVEPARAPHPPEVREGLTELFGLPREWSRSMRPLPWAQLTSHLPPFAGRTTVPLLLPCTTDPELAVTKYLRAVRDSRVPLGFLFNGTVFYDGSPPGHTGALMAAAIPWSAETTHDLPAEVWHRLVDRYHGAQPWLRLSRATHDRLDAYRLRQVLGSADDAVRELLDRSGAP